MGAPDAGLGGDGGTDRLRDGRVGEGVGGGAALVRGAQGGAAELVRDRAREVDDDGVGLFVRGGLERLVQGYGDGAGLRVPQREGRGGGERGQGLAVMRP